MKKIFSTMILLAVVAVVGCGKKSNNTQATTPVDCYNQGMNPAYFPQNPWVGQPPYAGYPPYAGQPMPPYAGQPPYAGYPPYAGHPMPPYAGQPPYGVQPPYQNGWNPYNVGCVSPVPGQPMPYQQVYYQNNPYYYVPQQPCPMNVVSYPDGRPVCPQNHVCKNQTGMYYWSLSWTGFNQQGVCVPVM